MFRTTHAVHGSQRRKRSNRPHRMAFGQSVLHVIWKTSRTREFESRSSMDKDLLPQGHQPVITSQRIASKLAGNCIKARCRGTTQTVDVEAVFASNKEINKVERIHTPFGVQLSCFPRCKMALQRTYWHHVLHTCQLASSCVCCEWPSPAVLPG